MTKSKTYTLIDAGHFFYSHTYEEYQEFHVSLGRLMEAFTRTEVNLSRTISVAMFRSLNPPSNPKIDVAFIMRSAFAGQRTAALKDTLKRLLRNLRSPKSKLDAVENILNQISEIQYVRDLLAHQHFLFKTDTKTIIIHNAYSVKEPGNEETIEISLETLDAMTYDLLRMHLLLTRHVFDQHTKWLPDHQASLDEPWRYKPSSLKRSGPKYEKSRPAPKRPPSKRTPRAR